jgi:thiol-disulfide isomerase/thioredoxin
MIPKHGKIFTNYLVESKDDIFLTEVDGNTKFTGTGSKKYELQYQLTNIYNYYSGLALHGMDNEMKLKISLRLLDLGLMKCLEYLDLAKAGLSIKEYELLRSERILEKELASKLIMHYNIDNADPANRIKIVTAIKQYQNNEKFLISFNVHPSGLFFKNSSYPSYILWSYQVDSCELSGKPFNIMECYHYIIKKFSGTLREKLITLFIYEQKSNAIDDLSFLVNDGLRFVRQPDFKSVLLKLKQSRIAGTKAYNFSLQDTGKNTRHLSEFRGHTVLMDFWFTGCGGCREIHPLLDSIRKIYKDRSFDLLSICVDQDIEVWKKSIKGGHYTSLDNVNLFTGGLSNPLIKYYDVNDFPAILLIDKTGRLFDPPADPRKDSGKKLITQIGEAMIR